MLHIKQLKKHIFLGLTRFLSFSPLQRCIVRVTNGNSARRLVQNLIVIKSFSTFFFKLECPEPDVGDYGAVERDGLTAGSYATYTCQKGFNVAGRAERQCLVIGQWEGSAPSCTSKSTLNPFPKNKFRLSRTQRVCRRQF